MVEQAEKVKLSATNIKSILVTNNEKLLKLRRTKISFRKKLEERGRRSKREKKLETRSGSFGRSLTNMGKSVLNEPFNIFTKVLTYLSILLLGTAINNIGEIKAKIDELFEKYEPQIQGFKDAVIDIYEGARDFIKTLNENPMVQGIKNMLNGRDFNMLKEEADKLNELAKEFDKEASGFGLDAMSKSSNPLESALARLPESNLRNIILDQQLSNTPLSSDSPSIEKFEDMVMDSDGLIGLTNLAVVDGIAQITGTGQSLEWLKNNAHKYGFNEIVPGSGVFRYGTPADLTSNLKFDNLDLSNSNVNPRSNSNLIIARQKVVVNPGTKV